MSSKNSGFYRLGRSLSITIAILGAQASVALAAASDRHGTACPLEYRLPADIDFALPVTEAEQTGAQYRFDRYSWETFLALSSPGIDSRPSLFGDNPTQWERWASTVDLLECQNNPAACGCLNNHCTPADRYYPQECQAIDGYWRYRVVGQISKVDDSFLEAGRGELSNHPVIDEAGRFLRYEILVNPVTYDFVVSNGLYNNAGLAALQEPVTFPCGEASYLGGDPSNPRMGAIVIKNAWMELDPRNPFDQFKARHHHTEDLLVYTPADRTLTGVAGCEVKTMALVGMHIAHKTVSQPTWIWSTFEHDWNAPDCTALPPEGDEEGSGPSTACPSSVPHGYNFYPKNCSEDAAGAMSCQSCNTVPLSNSPAPDSLCTSAETDAEGDTGWCLDLPPAAEQGKSKLCRQVPVQQYFPTAHALNQACSAVLGTHFGWAQARSVWSHYQLISTQWLNQAASSCQSSGPMSGLRPDIMPQINLAAAGAEAQMRPYLGNTSMESYGRSNCTGCHKTAAVKPDATSYSTDMMFWLQLEAYSLGSGGN